MLIFESLNAVLHLLPQFNTDSFAFLLLLLIECLLLSYLRLLELALNEEDIEDDKQVAEEEPKDARILVNYFQTELLLCKGELIFARAKVEPE